MKDEKEMIGLGGARQLYLQQVCTKHEYFRDCHVELAMMDHLALPCRVRVTGVDAVSIFMEN